MYAKKIRAISMALIASLSLTLGLVGCGSGDKNNTAASTTASSSTLEPVTLNWYFIGNGQAPDVELVEKEANKYLKDKINASIKLNCFDWGSYNQKMNNMIAAGEEFDIAFTCSWALDYVGNARKDAWVDLTDMMDKYAPKTKAALDPALLTGSKVDGRNYAIPVNKEIAAQYGVVLLKKYVDKYNFDLSKIKDIPDLEPLFKTIKENEPDVIPVSDTMGKIYPKYWTVTNAAVLRHDEKNPKFVLSYTQPEYKAHIELMRKFWKAGYIRKDAMTNSDYGADLKAGRIFCDMQALKPGKDKEMSASTGQEWVQVPLTPAYISTYDTMGAMQAISQTSKNPERALMFLELVNTDPYLNNLINFGIEGKHFEKISDNIIKKGPDFDKYNPGTPWMFANQFINYIWDTEDPQKWEKFKEFNAAAIPSVDLGFIPNDESIKNEIAAMEAVDKEYASLVFSNDDLDKAISSMLDKLKAAGSDKVLAERQKQFDEFLASKKQ